MNNVTFQIMAELASGQYRSGSALAKMLGISRTAIWKHIQRLEDYGLEVFAVSGKGYRLAAPLQLLDQQLIQSAVLGDFYQRVEVMSSIDSTNRQLREWANQGAESGTVLLAEHQSGGRGRRGRAWVSPFACNLYASILWRFADIPHGLGGLSLAIGVAVVEALESMGIHGVQLKWPNDLLYNERKLAGILLEMSGDPTGSGHLVIGVGINVAMPQHGTVDEITQPWTDLQQIHNDKICRNQLTISLLRQIGLMIEHYQQSGEQYWVARWNQLDAMRDRRVTLRSPSSENHGIAKGIDESGALLLEQDDVIHRIHSGEVSLRLADS